MPQPANPQPAPDFDSMLSRKFGKEVANYFSGSPLNRVGFLRSDHAFLTQALKHPSTNFLLCNELQPLVQPHAKDRLAYVKFDQVRPVVGENPYKTSEEEMLALYDSAQYTPQMIFLGIDEKSHAPDALSYQGKNLYTGAPYFAVDVTPRASVKPACEQLIARLQAQDLNFAKGRVMDLHASDGKTPTRTPPLTPPPPPCPPQTSPPPPPPPPAPAARKPSS